MDFTTGEDPESLSYVVRRSDRARHVRLQMSARDGLVVVVPRRFNARRLPELVAERREWIERTKARFGVEGQPSQPALPTALALSALEENWTVRYLGAAPGAPARSDARQETLTVCCATSGEAFAALRRFVGRRTRIGLGAELRTLAAARGRNVGRLSVRAQQTRWASCSSKGNISLNRNLAFLPAPLTRTVLLHELCHLEEMNHSARFWALLASEVPDLDARREELRTAWRHVPGWAR